MPTIENLPLDLFITNNIIIISGNELETNFDSPNTCYGPMVNTLPYKKRQFSSNVIKSMLYNFIGRCACGVDLCFA